jgi:hypothetical protein
VGLSVDDCPIQADGVVEVTRVGTRFTFPSITLENLTAISHLRHLPSHREIVWWLEECSRARGHGFPYLFRKGGPLPMEGHGRSISFDSDYSWVDSEVTKVVSYYQSVDQLNEISESPRVLGFCRSKGGKKGVQPLPWLWFCYLQYPEWGTGCLCSL